MTSLRALRVERTGGVADDGGEVDDLLHALQRAPAGVVVADVGHDEVDAVLALLGREVLLAVQDQSITRTSRPAAWSSSTTFMPT